MLRKLLLIGMTSILLFAFVGCGRDNSMSTEPTNEGELISPSASPLTDSANELYQLVDQNNVQMMSYVIKTKNNKIIVLDGGYERNAINIVKLAKEITGCEVPEIEAWFFSHSHDDHVDAFPKLINVSKPTLSVKQIYYNFPSEEFMRNYVGDYDNKTWDKFMDAVNKFDGEKTVVQQGDQFVIDDILIEVLLVPDESIKVNPINNASVVYRMTIDGSRVLFLGDLGTQGGTRLRKAYGNDLKCDIVQISHHGSGGVSKHMYLLMEPKICLWPSPDWMWSSKYENADLLKFLQEEVGTRIHYVAKDGMQRIVFPLNLE